MAELISQHRAQGHIDLLARASLVLSCTRSRSRSQFGLQEKMPPAVRAPLSIPESYDSLPLRQIKVSNVAESSQSVTPVLLVTLNRPSKLNAFTDVMREDLERVYELVDIDPRVKVVVLTGAGRSFCAGADLEIGFPGAQDENGRVRRPKVERDVDHRDG